MQGEEVQVFLHPVASWILGIAGVVIAATIIGTATSLVALTREIAIVKETYVTAEDVMVMQNSLTEQWSRQAEGFVTLREFTNYVEDIRGDLAYIRTLLERHMNGQDHEDNGVDT